MLSLSPVPAELSRRAGTYRFFLLAGTMVISALGVVLSRNLWRAAYCLVATLVLFTTIAAPFCQLLALLFVLGAVKMGARVPGLAPRSETVLTGFDPDEFRAAQGVAPDPLRFSIVHAGSASLDGKTATFLCFLDALRLWSRREHNVSDTVEVAFVGAEPSLRGAIAARVRS